MPIIAGGVSAGVVAAGVGAAGAIGGALINSSSASSAAGKQNAASFAALQGAQQQEATQQDYNNNFIGPGIGAAQNSLAMVADNQAALQPYQNALAPGGITESTLENTPGYQFNLAQGLKSTQSAAAARGLGVSGAALKGAASYATGLADSTYQNQYNDALNAYQAVGNQRNQLFGQNQQIASMGANAQANSASQALSYATGNTANITGNGNSQAAAAIAGGNALTSGLNGISNAATNYSTNQLLTNYLNGNGSQYSSSTVNPGTDQTNALESSGTFNALGAGYG